MALWQGADGSCMTGQEQLKTGALRQSGRDWPNLAHTMIGAKRMRNLQDCVSDVLTRGVPGDLVETGVWRGGACIFMRGILEAYGDRDRRVWVADSFQGLPRANAAKYPVDAAGPAFHAYPQLAVSQDQVEANFRSYGLLDDQVVMLPGFFRDSLPTAPIEQIAVLRLDGDMYESTMDALTSLYAKVSHGGYVIVDDYSIQGCREAITDFRAAQGINEPIHLIDWTGVFWRRGDGRPKRRPIDDPLNDYLELTGDFIQHMKHELGEVPAPKQRSRARTAIGKVRSRIGSVRRGL